MACVTLRAIGHFPHYLMSQNQYSDVLQTLSVGTSFCFFLEMNSPQLYLVVLSPAPVCFLIFLFFPLRGKVHLLCPELPIAQYQKNCFTKERKKYESPNCSRLLHSIGLLYVVVLLLLSMLLLLIAHFWGK